MARPPLDPQKRRSEYLRIRLTPSEMETLKAQAAEAGMPFTSFAREVLFGRKPKAKPARDRVFNDLLYELTSIATNFSQLEAALEDETFGQWARYVGGEMIERLMDRDDLIPLIEETMERLNAAGQVVNALARSANSGKEIKDAEVKETIGILQEVLEPLHKAAERPSKPPGGSDEV
ncbi:plasmid mobilization protein [Pacificispira sp.]|uniref:plasmid mobilization protein n=1 Tax=Pacificispira sp. TaxID=2888761 RepID=UPI003B516424